ncbi:MAG: PIN domain nuclease [Chloroflexi bacterium]|nr:PIN domain nuclease [Chloroflexota bacterium]
MPILVDTSVWIDLFKGRDTPQTHQLHRLAGEEELLLGDLILAELLQGLRSNGDMTKVENAFETFQVISLVGEHIARQSARNYLELRQQGITIRKTIDCLIATWCITNDVPLLHTDKDFHPFAQLGLVEI